MEKSELPEGWEETHLQSLLKSSVTYGILKNGEYDPSGIFMLRVMDISKNGTLNDTKIFKVNKNIEKKYERSRLSEGNIVLSVAATLGRSMVIPKELEGSNVNRALAVIKLKKSLPPNFIHYFIKSPFFQNLIQKNKVGTAQQVINLSNLSKFLIPIPPLNEQKRIVSKIEELFSTSKYLRNLLNKNLLHVAALKNSTLQDAFTGKLVTPNPNDPPVKIIPVIPKKNTGRKPSKDVKIGKAVLSVGKTNIVPPKGWKWIALLQVAELASGHTPKRQNPEYWNGKIPWVTGGDAGKYDGDYIFETKETITQLGVENSAAVILPKDTVCLAREASIGYCVLLGKPMATNQRFVNFICGESLMPKYLMYLFLFERNYMFRFKEGSIFGTIYFPAVKAFHICLPPLNEQKRIIAKIDLLWSFAKKIESEIILKINTLNSFEKSVLKQAFEGKLVPQDPNDEPASELLERIKLVN